MATVFLAFGSNQNGKWGAPGESIARAIAELEASGATVCHKSPPLHSRPVGPGLQQEYVNLVARIATERSARELLHCVKHLERLAGRGLPRRWAPRPLDIDIIDYNGQIIGWNDLRPQIGRLIVPHPFAHRRRFVLEPLAQVAPYWRHPVLGLRVGELLHRLPHP